MTGLPLYLEIFDNLGKKNLKFLTIFICSIEKFCFDTKKNYPIDKVFLGLIKNFFYKKHI